MPVDPFPYTPLKGSEIRYITLHAFDGSVKGRNWLEGVQGTLRQAPLEKLDFTALSYTWGDPGETRTIRISGVPFRVTVNLATCLWHFATSPAYHGVKLWVDAICINQGDLAERNAQVWRMKDIYAAAASVKAWIGLGLPQTRVGMQRLRALPDLATASDPLLLAVDARASRALVAQALEGEGAAGLEAVFLSPYWQRAWVVQELHLGRDVAVVCGRDEVALRQLFVWNALAFKHGSHSADPWPPDDPVEVPPAIVRLVEQRNALPQLLMDVKELLCSDPRDRIYCLLGMAEGWEAEAIVPDYARPALKVCGDVVQGHLEKSDKLEVLQYGQYDEDRDPSYPSWIPDWRSADAKTNLFPFSGFSLPGVYNASKGLPLSSHPWRLDRDHEKLHLSGVLLDTITAVSRSDFELQALDKYSDLELARAWFEWGHAALAPASTDPASAYDRSARPGAPRYALGGHELLSQACRRTLVADYDLAGSVRDRVGTRGNQYLFPDDEDERWSDGAVHSHRETHEGFRLERLGKRIAVTSQGWIGLVVREADVGDHVAVVVGAAMPLILRAAPENEQAGRDEGLPDEYRLVGHGYLHGLMDGQGLDMGEIGEIVIR